MNNEKIEIADKVFKRDTYNGKPYLTYCLSDEQDNPENWGEAEFITPEQAPIIFAQWPDLKYIEVAE